MENLEFLEVSDDEEECFYEVEAIVGMHITEDGERMYEIKWKGYSSSYIRSVHDASIIDAFYFVDRENTFEPERNLNCPELLKAFLEKVNASNKEEQQQ